MWMRLQADYNLAQEGNRIGRWPCGYRACKRERVRRGLMALSAQGPRPATTTRWLDTAPRGRSRPADRAISILHPLRCKDVKHHMEQLHRRPDYTTRLVVS